MTHSKSSSATIRYLLATAAISLSPLAAAQQSGSQVIDQVNIEEEASCYQLDLKFNVLVSYLRHFPLTQGKELYIRLQLAPAPERDARLIRERRAIALPQEITTPLVTLVYEGDADEGPTLVLHYSEAQQFSVQQGKDFRSLSIQFGLPIDHCIASPTMGAE